MLAPVLDARPRDLAILPLGVYPNAFNALKVGGDMRRAAPHKGVKDQVALADKEADKVAE